MKFLWAMLLAASSVMGQRDSANSVHPTTFHDATTTKSQLTTAVSQIAVILENPTTTRNSATETSSPDEQAEQMPVGISSAPIITSTLQVEPQSAIMVASTTTLVSVTQTLSSVPTGPTTDSRVQIAAPVEKDLSIVQSAAPKRILVPAPSNKMALVTNQGVEKVAQAPTQIDATAAQDEKRPEFEKLETLQPISAPTAGSAAVPAFPNDMGRPNDVELPPGKNNQPAASSTSPIFVAIPLVFLVCSVVGIAWYRKTKIVTTLPPQDRDVSNQGATEVLRGIDIFQPQPSENTENWGQNVESELETVLEDCTIDRWIGDHNPV
jgi:hypothetical protein